MEWVKKFLKNSCDINLEMRINEKFDQLYEYEQGGIMYLKIVMDETFTMSNIVVMLLQNFLKKFANEGIARVLNDVV